MKLFRTILLAFLSIVAASSGGLLEIPLSDFRFEGTGNYTSRMDERQLAHITHPLAAASKGDTGRIVAKIRFPKEAKPPLKLSFYASNNHERSPQPNPKAIAAGSGSVTSLIDERVGHRWMKCWINGEEVWKRDTIEKADAQPVIVQLPAGVKPGEEFELALGLEEAIDSSTRLPEDRQEMATGSYGGYRLDFARYETRSFWGNVTLLWANAMPPAKDWPWEIATHPVAIEAPMKAGGREVRIEKAALLKGRWGWPVEMGIPFRQGLLEGEGVALRFGTHAVPLEEKVFSKWPDGTTKWSTVRFTLRPNDTIEYDGVIGMLLEARTQKAPDAPLKPVSVANRGREVMLSTEELQLSVTSGGSFKVADRKLGERIAGLKFFCLSEDVKQEMRWKGVAVAEESQWQSTVRMRGELMANGKQWGDVILKATVFADLPYVKVGLTLLPKGRELPMLSTYGVRFAFKGAPRATPFADGLLCSGGAGSLIVALREARFLQPNAISAARGEAEFALYKGKGLKLYSGEALASELWIALSHDALSEDEAKAFAALVETPPRLDTSALIRESLVWGPMPAIERGGEVDHKVIEASLRPHFAHPLVGIRDFGDYDRGVLRSFYWNAVHTLYALYAMTGERDWYDWADRSARRQRDSFVNRSKEDGRPSGGIKSRSSYDGAPAYNGKLQMVDGLFDYAQMNGDSEVAKLARGVADFLVTDAGMRNQIMSRSSRENGWPILFLMRAYRETGDERYLNAAGDIVAKTHDYIDARRGAYLQIHGNQSYPGVVPFMNGILMTGLREYYQVTADKRAGELLVKLAWAVYCEMHEPSLSKALPNIDYEYSPNPYRRDPTIYTPLTSMNVAISAGQAYAAAISGDARLAEIAARGLEGFVTGKKDVNTPAFCFDLPAALYWNSGVHGPFAR